MDDVNKLDDSIVNKDSNYYENNSIDNNNINDEILSASSEDVGYRAFIPNTTLNYGSGGLIYVNLDSPSGYVFSPSTYSYDFYLKIYDESGNLIKTSNEYSGTGKGLTTLHWIVDSAEIDNNKNPILRKYRVDLVSSNRVITSGNLFITHNSKYTVKLNLNDTIIKKSKGTEIIMTVTQYYDSIRKYDFYLKVYDSNNNLKINKHYYNSDSNSVDILNYIIKPNELPVDTYRIEISGADYTYNSNKLQVLYDDLGYSVDLKDSYIDYGNTNTIRLNVMPDTSNPASYYDFFINVYDSKNLIKLQKTCRGSQWGTVSVDLDVTKLNVDTYNIVLKSTNGAYILDTAKLIVTNTLNNKYLLSVSDTTINFGSDGSINMKMFPAYTGNNYTYDFNLIVYDSKYNQIINERYNNTSNSASTVSYKFSPMSLKSGNYTINLRGINGNSQSIYSKLIVKPKPSSDYSVSILSDVTVKSGYNGQITMCVSPTKTNFNYVYDFYVKVYDSYNREKFSKRFNKVEYSSCNVYTSVGYNFEPGIYTIKLIDTEGNFVMDAAKLTVMALSHSDYSVSVSNNVISYNYYKCIEISVSPASSGYYLYDFYLKIYDSNNIEKVSKRYYGSTAVTSVDYFPEYDEFEPGNYTVKLLNNGDNYVMATDKLIIKSVPYYGYSISVEDVNLTYGLNESIKMSVTAKQSYFFTYDFYLKIFDSNNIEKVIKRFSSKKYSRNTESYYIDSKILGVGNYTIKIINYEDNRVMRTVNLRINKMPSKILASDITTEYNENNYLIATLKDQQGNIIKGAEMSINMGNITSLITDYNGQIKLSTKGLSPKTYITTISFNGDANYGQSTITTKIVVNKIKTSLSSEDVSVNYNTGGYLVATLKDSNDNPIKGVNILINITGVKTFTTDSNGQVKLSTKGLVPKTYSVTITFNGDKYFDKVSKTVKVTIKKATPKLTASKKTFKKLLKTKKYTVTLKTNQNKVMKKVWITLKINKKTYKVKTNSKGQAIFKITNLKKKGTFKATVKYAGSKYYNAKTVNTKITVK